MNDFRIPPPGLFDRIYDLLAWDRDTWDVDPPDGWVAPEQRSRAD